MGKTPFILFITGISASGKTTLYEDLRKDSELADVRFHDIDEDGVPLVGRSQWRSFRVELLLYEAILALDKEKSSIISGIIKPHEVIESKYFRADQNIHFLLLETPVELFEERIKARLSTQPQEGTFDPAFNPDAMAELMLSTKNLKRVLEQSIATLKQGHVISAAESSQDQLGASARSLIKQLSS